MRPCPVCDSPVSGLTCEVCGKQLGAPSAGPGVVSSTASRGAGLGAVSLGVVSNPLSGAPNKVSDISSADISSASLLDLAGTMEGLEFTRLEVPDGVGLALEPTPGMEPTLAPAVPEIPGEPLLGWEATLAAPVVAAPVGELPDLDRGRAIVETGPVGVPAPRTCRYCRNVQPSGLLCDQCGMRLPPVQSERPAPLRAATGERVRCLRCGERTPIEWERCGSCGGLLPAAES
jgi:hypothetical protein